MLAALYVALTAIPIAHDTGLPHTDPIPVQDPSATTDGGPATLVILLGVAFTLATLAALIYLKQRMAERNAGDERSE